MAEVIAGIVGGIVGGLAIAALGMVYGALSGRGFWALPNVIGGLVLGPERATSGSFGVATLIGAVLHLILSAIYGVVIAIVGLHLTHSLVPTGILIGILVWVANYYGVGSFHAGSRQVAILNPAPVALVLHALFGLITALVAGALLP